jgi:hypothetical protein
MAERRRQYFKDKECAHCGAKIKLVNHHTDRSTKKSHKFWSWTEEKRKEELAKCVVLCAECHKKEHGYNQNYHGTITGYNHHKCRCSLCTEAMSKKGRDYRARKKAELLGMPG